jgi:hypothetical protein
MSFAAAFAAAAAHAKRARRLSDLEYRFNRRFRLWERPNDEQRDARICDLSVRRRAAIASAEDAEHDLNLLWDATSARMPPIGTYRGQLTVIWCHL